MTPDVRLTKFFWVALLTTLPVFARAQSVEELISGFQKVLQVIIPVLFVLATVVFLWGVIQYISAGGNEEAIKKGKQLIIWGLAGLTIMLAVWGIVRAITQTLGIGGAIPPFEQPWPATIKEKVFNPLIQLLFILATVVFLWGVVEFIAGATSEEKRTKGKQHIMWGIIGMAIMLAAGGIIAVIEDFFRSI